MIRIIKFKTKVALEQFNIKNKEFLIDFGVWQYDSRMCKT